jgi:D-alanyl-lipoteichoic acid acyltransferase DltB (MBOAT superfamily)
VFNFKYCIKLIIRILSGYLCYEAILYLTSTSTLHSSFDNVSYAFSNASLQASLTLKGTMIFLKYLFIYGITILINSSVGMRTTIPPRCVVLVHTNGELWRTFDTGFYEFMKFYVYIPLGGNKTTKLKQLFAMALSFSFIYYWHGMTFNIKIWCFVNFLVICCEMIGFKTLRQSEKFDRLVINID